MAQPHRFHLNRLRDQVINDDGGQWGGDQPWGDVPEGAADHGPRDHEAQTEQEGCESLSRRQETGLCQTHPDR